MNLTIVGVGPGSAGLCTQSAIAAIKSADLVLTSVKVNEHIQGMTKKLQQMKVMEIVDFIKTEANSEKNIVILASGDVGYYSIAATMRNHLGPDFEMILIPGISSLQLMCAKCHLGYEDLRLLSLHGRAGSIVPFVTYNRKVFTLTGGEFGVKEILEDLIDSGLEDVTVYVGENLSLENERVTKGTPKELLRLTFEKLAVMIVVNSNYTNCHILPKDDDYARGKRPMTKEAVRNLSVDMLQIEPNHLCWDVGAGTGGVTVAMARRASESFVYAVEALEEGVELIEENIRKLGANNIKPVFGMAPEALESLPVPDKVFIGGSKGQMSEVVKLVLDKNPKATIVVNAITLETIGEALAVFKEMKLDTEIVSISAAKSKKLGRYNMMMGENPIYIIKGELIEESENS